MKLIDLHCDTVMRLMKHPESNLKNNTFAVNIDQMIEADSMAQTFALFVDMNEVESPLQTGFEMMERLWGEIHRNEDQIAWAGNSSDIRMNLLKDKRSVLISIEEGGVLEGFIGNLHNFYRQGIRMVTLTWNYPNEIGFPHGEEHGHKGLTPFGFELVQEMERIGMIVDVSHLSEAGFWDVEKTLQGPFMATHSNCYSIHAHSRNLKDDQIAALGNKGGVMGINIVKIFLKSGEDTGRLEAMVSHINHAVKTGGIEVVAIGTDFDGTPRNEELAGLSDITKLIELLKKEKYSDDQIEKIWYRNALRVIDKVLV